MIGKTLKIHHMSTNFNILFVSLSRPKWKVRSYINVLEIERSGSQLSHDLNYGHEIRVVTERMRSVSSAWWRHSLDIMMISE